MYRHFVAIAPAGGLMIPSMLLLLRPTFLWNRAEGCLFCNSGRFEPEGIKIVDIITTIKNRPDLLLFFVKSAQTEVPIAGIVHGHFVSRRIDRLLINHNTKTIDFIDYKTDTDKNAFIEQYKYQLKEYTELLRSAYPNYKINGYILWLHDWTLDKIIS